MFEHGGMLALHHALNERLCRIGGGIVFALVAYSSCAFYLLVHTKESWLLMPYFE